MENLNAEAINELETQTKYAKFIGSEGVLLSAKCAIFVLEHAQHYEQRIKELTQAHKMLSESYDHLEKTKDELLSERSRLTEENERLRAELEQRPPKLIITKLPKKENENV